MYSLGLNPKVKAVLNPAEGYPKMIAKERISQGEIVEVSASHDISLIQAGELCNISKSFFHCIQPNPIKLKDANEKTDSLYKELVSEVLQKGNPDKEEIEKIKEDPRLIDLFHGLKWMDVIIGHIPYYLEDPIPNCEIKWNEKSGLWQVVALIEILPDETLTILQKAK